MLNAVEHDGEIFVVTRGGRGVARIGPAGGASGAAVKALLRRHQADSTWSDELRELRAVVPTQDRVWPD